MFLNGFMLQILMRGKKASKTNPFSRRVSLSVCSPSRWALEYSIFTLGFVIGVRPMGRKPSNQSLQLTAGRRSEKLKDEL